MLENCYIIYAMKNISKRQMLEFLKSLEGKTQAEVDKIFIPAIREMKEKCKKKNSDW
jgi:hypothetical protein